MIYERDLWIEKYNRLRVDYSETSSQQRLRLNEREK